MPVGIWLFWQSTACIPNADDWGRKEIEIGNRYFFAAPFTVHDRQTGYLFLCDGSAVDPLFDRDVAIRLRPDILGAGADEFVVAPLLKDMGGPADGPAYGKNRGKEIRR